MNERQCEQVVFYAAMLEEIRDILAARLPVPEEIDRLKQAHHDAENKVDELLHGRDAEIERLRKENADLHDRLDRAAQRESDGIAMFDKLLAEERSKVANLQHSVNELAALKAADKPGRWVLFDENGIACRYRDRSNWHRYPYECESPWPTERSAMSFAGPKGFPAINLDEHKETP